MYFSDEWKKYELNSVPSDPIQGCKITSLISMKDLPSNQAAKNKEAGNLQEEFWPYECATRDKQFHYLYSFEGCQIDTSVRK